MQCSRTEASPSDGLVSYAGHSLRESFITSAEMQSAYSTPPVDWDAKKMSLEKKNGWDEQNRKAQRKQGKKCICGKERMMREIER